MSNKLSSEFLDDLKSWYEEHNISVDYQPIIIKYLEKIDSFPDSVAKSMAKILFGISNFPHEFKFEEIMTLKQSLENLDKEKND